MERILATRFNTAFQPPTPPSTNGEETLQSAFSRISRIFENHTPSTQLKGYRGNFKDGFPDGQGVMMKGNKNCYFGKWRNGRKDGPGEEIAYCNYPQEHYRHYVGDYQSDVRSGFGKMRYFDRNGILLGTYIGEWKNNTWEGQGLLTNGDSTGSGFFNKGVLVDGRVKSSFFGLFEFTVIKYKDGISKKTPWGKIFT